MEVLNQAGNPLMLQSKPISFSNPTALARAVANEFLGNTSLPAGCVALSGGRITKSFFEALVADAPKGSLASAHFFFADERCLPPTDPESNFALAQTHLFQPLAIAPGQIHRLRGEIDPTQAAREAETELRGIVKATKDGQPVLDLVFLGMGEDGHIASLFPAESESMMSDSATYRAVFDSPKPPPQRLTLGYRSIAAAREIWVLASGGGKEAALRESLSPTGHTPLGRLLRLRADVKVFTDIKTG